MDNEKTTTPAAPAQAEPVLTADLIGGERGEVRLVMADGWTYAYMRTPAAAARLVRVVNCHYDLVTALRNMLGLNAALARACTDRVDITQDSRPSAAWAVLAKAEGRA